MKHTLLDVRFCDRISAERIRPEPGWAIISISSAERYPDVSTAATLQPGWGFVLRLAFDDVHDRGPGLHGISEDQAMATLRFLDDIAGQATRLVVHCEGGVSRSAAVAKFAARRFHLPFDDNYGWFNCHVYRTLCTVAAGPAAADNLQ